MACIVVIDDEETIRCLLDEGLQKDNHRVCSAEDGRKGVALFREEKPDLVITDIFMPEKEGVETIQEIKAISPSVPIIAISGGGRFQQDNMLTLAQKLGADVVLKKPFGISEIRETVQNMLEHSA